MTRQPVAPPPGAVLPPVRTAGVDVRAVAQAVTRKASKDLREHKPVVQARRGSQESLWDGPESAPVQKPEARTEATTPPDPTPAIKTLADLAKAVGLELEDVTDDLDESVPFRAVTIPKPTKSGPALAARVLGMRKLK